MTKTKQNVIITGKGKNEIAGKTQFVIGLAVLTDELVYRTILKINIA